MMTKEEALQYIKTLSEQGIITREELNFAYDSGEVVNQNVAPPQKIGVSMVLSCIGVGIVFLGIATFIIENWSTLNFATKTLTTLGVGIVAYFVGILFSRKERTTVTGIGFYIISILLIPIGIFVILDNAGVDVSEISSMNLIAFILFIVYTVPYIVFRNNIFIPFALISATVLFFTLTSLVASEKNLIVDDWDFFVYRLLVVGIVYMLLGRAFTKTVRAPLSNNLYFYGSFLFLCAPLMLRHHMILWNWIYPVLVAGILFLSVHTKTRSLLTIGAFFLMVYIVKITTLYFRDSLGWHLALVIAGLAMIGVGYATFSLKKKYFVS